MKTASLLISTLCCALIAGQADAQAKKADKKVDAGVAIDAGVVGPQMPTLSATGESTSPASRTSCPMRRNMSWRPA